MKNAPITSRKFPLPALSAINIALLLMLPITTMAFDFPTTTIPGMNTGTPTTPAAVLIFSCNNIGAETITSGNSSCSSSGGSSSSCSSSSVPNLAQSKIIAWEMTADRPALQAILNDVNTTCSEAVEAAGFNNCESSGGDTKTVYTCKLP